MPETDGIKLPIVGERLAERYTIVERVSYGGFGAVYKAIQDTLGREVAIKVILPEIFLSNKDYVEQFRQEALLTSQLRHPNTITIFDYGQTSSELLFLVMEWLDGKTLADLLREEGAIAYDRTYHIAYQIMKSLSEAHDRGMVHRDLKPSNLFLCTQYGENDFVKVLDFGLVKNLDSAPLKMRGKTVEPPKFTEKRRAPGTPHYMAPEQATGKGTTTSADIYSFGLIIHEMLTGKRAVDGNDKMEVLLRQARDPVPPLPAKFTNTFLGKVVARCVEKDPLKRPQKAADLVRDFQRVEDGGGGTEVQTSEIRTTDHWKPLAHPKTGGAEVSSGPGDQFVGRTQELDEFSGLLEKRMAAGRGVVMTITGPTGIGKTALVNAYAGRFREQGGETVARGGFLPHQGAPLDGLRRALRALLGLRAEEHTEGRHEIRRGLERMGVYDIYLLNFLANFIYAGFGNEPTDSEECLSRLDDFVERMAQRGPFFLVLENLQWADAQSLEFMWRLSVGVARAWPLFLIGTVRGAGNPENRELELVLERFQRLDHDAYRDMRLGPLGKRECFALIESAIRMQRPMANRCLALSKGNPLYLNLVLRYLIDEAEHLSKRITDSGSISSKLYLPSSLEKISLRRVDQVVRKYGNESFRLTLARAALVGEAFRPAVLEKLLRKEGKYDLVDRLPRTLELWRREGVLRRPWELDETTEFAHPHLVEFFHDDATAELHLLIARTKEAIAHDEPGSIDPTELARHFRAAGDNDQALRHLLDAARMARERNALMRARELYEQLLPMLESEDHNTRSIAVECNLQLGEICLEISEYAPSLDYFERAYALAQITKDNDAQARCFCGRADLALAQNRLDDADRHFHRARGLIRDDDKIKQGRLLLGMGRVSSLKGDWEASQSCFQRAYEFGASGQEYVLMARAVHELGRTAVNLGNLRAAHEWFEQGLKYFRATKRIAEQAEVLLDLAESTFRYRRVEDARKLVDEAVETEQRLGDQIGVARGLARLGWLEANLLHVDDAQKFVLRALPVFKTHGDLRGLALCQLILAHIECTQGNLDAAQTMAQNALENVEQIGALAPHAEVLGLLGLIALYQGRADDALSTLESGVMLLDVHGSDAHRTDLQRTMGLHAESVGDFGRAMDRYRDAHAAALRGEWLERQYRARLAMTRLNVLSQGGRWYYEDLWEMAHDARSYGMRTVQIETLVALSWFEGVYGDQQGWEAAIAELNHHMRLHRIPSASVLKPFSFIADTVRHRQEDVRAAFSRSADWLRQSLMETAAAPT